MTSSTFQPNAPRFTARPHGFSLVELLLSVTVLAILLLMVSEMLNATQNTWKEAKTRVSQFRDARIAFETITRNLSQATLNTYFDYYDKDGERMAVKYESRYGAGSDEIVEPDRYDRWSELHFYVERAQRLFKGGEVKTNTHALFFQAPLGDVRKHDEYGNLGNLLNGRGYFVLLDSDELTRPAFLRNSYDSIYRFRLMEYRPPSEDNRIYANQLDWFATSKQEVVRDSRIIADNIIALIVAPVISTKEGPDDKSDPDRHKIAPDYVYDSLSRGEAAQYHQLPPLVQVTMVAMDEESAKRYGINSGTGPDEFVATSLFQNNARDFERDLKKLEENLADRNINYRVFSATVAVRGAKWSEDFVSVPGG